MNDTFKMFLIALVTSVGTQLVITPYVIRLNAPMPDRASAPPTEVPSSPPAETEVKLTAPNLEGMKVDEARERWRGRDLSIIEDGERAGSGAEPGTIVGQRPSPGVELSSKEIRVVVAKESADIEVPNVAGQSFEDARAALVGAGFEVPEPNRESSDAPTGQVIQQLPSAGARAKSGSIVRLVVAGPETVKVPTLRGLYFARAKKELEDAGLTLGTVRRVEDTQRFENYVLRQDPDTGLLVAPGTSVDLVIVAPD